MIRFLTPVAFSLAIAFVPIPGEAAPKRIHVFAKLVEQTFTGDPRNPKLSDRLINHVEFYHEDGTKVGVGAAVCTIVNTKKLPRTLVQCLLTGVFEQGRIVLGGEDPFPEPGVVGHFGILGGTDAFRRARGEATLVVQSDRDIDGILDID
jgi:hypothetical protein